jgi:hypothetical protein
MVRSGGLTCLQSKNRALAFTMAPHERRRNELTTAASFLHHLALQPNKIGRTQLFN